jgi:hypothetical protein
MTNYFDREVTRRAYVEARWDFRENEKREIESEIKRKAGVCLFGGDLTKAVDLPDVFPQWSIHVFPQWSIQYMCSLNGAYMCSLNGAYMCSLNGAYMCSLNGAYMYLILQIVTKSLEMYELPRYVNFQFGIFQSRLSCGLGLFLLQF